MVRPAWVAHPGQAGKLAALGMETGGSDDPWIGSGEGQYPPLPRHRPYRAASAADLAAAIVPSGRFSPRGCSSVEFQPESQGLIVVGTMIFVRPTLLIPALN